MIYSFKILLLSWCNLFMIRFEFFIKMFIYIIKQQSYLKSDLKIYPRLLNDWFIPYFLVLYLILFIVCQLSYYMFSGLIIIYESNSNGLKYQTYSFFLHIHSTFNIISLLIDNIYISLINHLRHISIVKKIKLIFIIKMINLIFLHHPLRW